MTAEPFRIAIADQALHDLETRLRATRWPNEARGGGWRMGTDLTYMRALVDHWLGAYDWRHWEARLNRFAQYRAEIDGLKIHFLVEPGSGDVPLPLILTHGWPGSFFEFDQVIEPLAHPERFGGDIRDAFTVICPTLPGYGFSDAPAKPLGPRAIAGMWRTLMVEVLGHERFVAQAGDWGAIVTSWLALDHPENLAAMHLNMMPLRPHLGPETAPLSEAEKAWIAAYKKRWAAQGGYFAIQGTKPQTLAYGLADSPVGLAAWIIEKFQHRLAEPAGSLSLFSMDRLITNVMLYWLTNSHDTATWLYHAVTHEGGLGLGPGPDGRGERVQVATGFAFMPHDLVPPPPAGWPERAYNVVHRTDFAEGGHFTAFEQGPELIADMREFFRAYRP